LLRGIAVGIGFAGLGGLAIYGWQIPSIILFAISGIIILATAKEGQDND
jgi:hypothetical protein